MQLFLYLGLEEFRKREAMTQVLQKNHFSLQQLQSYHASSVKLEEIQDLLLSPPLFGAIAPVLLTDINLLSAKDQKRLAGLCTLCRKAEGTNTLFFLYSKENKAPAVLGKALFKSEQKVFWELSETEKKQHIVTFCQKADQEIEDSAVEILLERVSGDLVSLESTLATVFLYLGGNKHSGVSIDEELLSQIFTQNRNASIYDLFHHMVERNLGRSLLAVDSLLLQGSSKAPGLMIQLLYQWDKLLQIKERVRFDSFEDVCSAEYIRTKALKADMRCGIKNYELEDLRRIQKINEEYNLSIKISSGIQDHLLKYYVHKVFFI